MTAYGRKQTSLKGSSPARGANSHNEFCKYGWLVLDERVVASTAGHRVTDLPSGQSIHYVDLNRAPATTSADLGARTKRLRQICRVTVCVR